MLTEHYINNKQVLCKPISTFVNKLIDKGFTIIDNGDYGQEKNIMPNQNSLFFRLQSPVDLCEVDIAQETYDLVPFAGNLYMCECHYNLVKLLPPQ